MSSKILVCLQDIVYKVVTFFKYLMCALVIKRMKAYTNAATITNNLT